MVIELYSDGACKGNPGVGAYGIILRQGAHEKEFSGGEPHTTNNRMELMGVIEGLKKIKKKSTVHVYVDSEYVRKGITEWIHTWIKNNWENSAKKPVANQDLWQQLLDLTTNHSIQWFWVKGHSGHPENERCDEIANAYIRENF